MDDKPCGEVHHLICHRLNGDLLLHVERKGDVVELVSHLVGQGDLD